MFEAIWGKTKSHLDKEAGYAKGNFSLERQLQDDSRLLCLGFMMGALT